MIATPILVAAAIALVLAAVVIVAASHRARIEPSLHRWSWLFEWIFALLLAFNTYRMWRRGSTLLPIIGLVVLAVILGPKLVTLVRRRSSGTN